MSKRSLAVVSAGLSQPSSTRMLADQLSGSVRRALEQQGLECELKVVELRDHAHDLMNNMLTGFPAKDLREAVEGVTHADGLIAVSPIFNASYSGLFKSFFDVLEPESLAGKPVLLGATGGTPRHSLALEHALRPMFAYLGSVVVPTSVYAATEDWGGGSAGDALARRGDRAGTELADLIATRPSVLPADPFDAPTPFEELLAGR